MIDDYVKQWLMKADIDFRMIENEMELPEYKRVNEGICFHCQQMVEKYLKGFLISHNVNFPKTHDIEYLLEKCSIIDEDFMNIEVADLSNFAVSIRYSIDYETPDMEEVKFYYELAKRIRALVLKKLGLDKE